MSDRLATGIWARVANESLSERRWHHVVGWHDGRVELGCLERDSILTWAMENADTFAVDRAPERPAAQLCLRCRLRDQIAAPLFAPEAA